jgi:D-amino-acid oxidase
MTGSTEEPPEAEHPPSHPGRVIVVGAGVVGLSCAVRLLERGHRVDVLARDLPLETTSSVAGGLWYPYRAYPVARVAGWSRTGYRELSRLAGVDGAGVTLREGTELHRAPTADPWWREAVPSLTRMVVGALPEHADVVVNAAGLGARLTAEDSSVHPVRGQVVLVSQVGLERWWLGSAPDGAPVYVVPRSRDIVVGGTDDEGEWSRTPDPAAAERILARATELVPELAHAAVLRHRVGLRPARPEVRLETERRGESTVVHCYGHGGAGVTLSWGCAAEVADEVDRALSRVSS